jgi:predicted nucleotidyltransferase
MNPLTQKITNYFKTRTEVVAIYLFGSYAINKERPFSDLDIGIIFDDDKLENSEMLCTTYQSGLARLTRRDIDLVVMNVAGEGLLKQIFKNGKCILVKNDKKLSLFKMISYSKIADFKYHYTKMQKSFIKSITQ